MKFLSLVLASIRMFLASLFLKKEDEVVRGITEKERYVEKKNSFFKKKEIDRYGRFKVAYSDGTKRTVVGPLSGILQDNPDTLSTASSYREIP